MSGSTASAGKRASAPVEAGMQPAERHARGGEDEQRRARDRRLDVRPDLVQGAADPPRDSPSEQDARGDPLAAR